MWIDTATGICASFCVSAAATTKVLRHYRTPGTLEGHQSWAASGLCSTLYLFSGC